MDFRGRNQTERVAATPAQPAAAPASFGANQFEKLDKIAKKPVGKLLKIGVITLLFSLTGLVIALTFLLGFSGNNQAGNVNKDKYQAVFLNNGQVYFGNIKAFGAKSLDLRNIYYLQTSGTDATNTQASGSGNVSLVKLGCELHAPYDQMIINSEQVIFWENLQDSSQVVKAISEYKKQNANQPCASGSSSSTQQAPSTSTQNTTSTTPTPAPTPTPTPTTKKP